MSEEKRNGERMGFYIMKQNKKLIKQYALALEKTQSEFINSLVERYHLKANPEAKIAQKVKEINEHLNCAEVLRKEVNLLKQDIDNLGEVRIKHIEKVQMAAKSVFDVWEHTRDTDRVKNCAISMGHKEDLSWEEIFREAMAQIKSKDKAQVQQARIDSLAALKDKPKDI